MRDTCKECGQPLIEVDDELPEEAADELLICRVLITPPERQADAPLPGSHGAFSGDRA